MRYEGSNVKPGSVTVIFGVRLWASRGQALIVYAHVFEIVISE